MGPMGIYAAHSGTNSRAPARGDTSGRSCRWRAPRGRSHWPRTRTMAIHRHPSAVERHASASTGGGTRTPAFDRRPSAVHHHLRVTASLMHRATSSSPLRPPRSLERNLVRTESERRASGEEHVSRGRARDTSVERQAGHGYMRPASRIGRELGARTLSAAKMLGRSAKGGRGVRLCSRPRARTFRYRGPWRGLHPRQKRKALPPPPACGGSTDDASVRLAGVRS